MKYGRASHSFPIRVERRKLSLPELGEQGLRSLIAELDLLAEDVGCVIIHDERPYDTVVTIFAGNSERFHMLSVARELTCPVIYFQDPTSGWYQGSNILPDIRQICIDFLVDEISDAAHPIFFGQSSGGYAALVASTFVRGATVIACAPQTFPDAIAKEAIRFVGVRALSTPADIIDLSVLLAERSDKDAFRAIVISASEYGNPPDQHFWMDYLHALRLPHTAGVKLFVVNSAGHSIVHRNARKFAVILGAMADNIMLNPDMRANNLELFLNDKFMNLIDDCRT